MIGAIDKLSDIQPRDASLPSLIGFASAVAVAGSIFFWVAGSLLARMFVINSVLNSAPSGTRSQIAEMNRASNAGIIFGIFIVLAATLVLGLLVGWRSMRYGAWLGAVCGSVLCFTQGIAIAFGLRSLLSNIQRTDPTGAAHAFPWIFFLVMCAAVVSTAALGGWLGEYTRTDRAIGSWPFSKVLAVAGGSLCVALILLAVGGMVKGALSKPSKGGLEAAAAKMQSSIGWAADIYEDENINQSRDPDALLLYQKDKGFCLFTEFGSFDRTGAEKVWMPTFAVVPSGTYHYSPYGKKWSPTSPDDFALFEPEKIRNLKLTKKSTGTFQGEQCDCYQVEIRALSGSHVLPQAISDSEGQKSADVAFADQYDGDIWVSGKSGNVLRIDYRQTGIAARVNEHQVRIIFKRFGEGVLDGVALP
jgi:MFS family permease